MKKVSLLAASVAFALTGCGGSDGDSSGAAPSGVVITGFDGYFKNAVVFDDKNSNAQLDSSDIILGLTNSSGQVDLTQEQFDSIESLGLQTLTPGGDIQQTLIARDPETFAGVYTIDMDHATQAMEHEIVFRAIPGEDVISPLTDLVAIEVASGSDVDTAKEDVNTALGLDASSESAFGDVIADGDAELHKTAQILTESKAAAENNNEAYVPTDAAEQATGVVENATPDEIADKNFKPIVDTDVPAGETPADPIINNKLVVVDSAKQHLLSQIGALELTPDAFNIAVALADEEDNALFNDGEDNPDTSIVVSVSITDKMGNEVTGFTTLTANNGGNLEIIGTPSITRDVYVVTLTAIDVNKDKVEVGSTSTTFDLTVEVNNEAPEVVAAEQTKVQAWFDDRELAQGVTPSLDYVIISDLFDDEDTLTYDAYTSVAGLEIFIDDQSQMGADAVLTLNKAPTYAYPAGETVTISAYDGVNTTYVTFTLPEIQEQNIKADPTEVQGLQSDLNTILADMKVGEKVTSNATFDISELFEDDYVNGSLEYYVGLENDEEGKTTIPGITVSIDSNNNLVISGTPTEAVTDGRFIMMAGVNVDVEGEVISEPVSFTLPSVAPANDGGEPEPTPELKFTTEHFIGGVWQMGSFDYGDAEVAFASLRSNNGQLELCFATDDSSSYSTLSRQDWLSTLDNMQHNYWDLGADQMISDDDCGAVTLNSDGTMSIPSDDPALSDTASLLFENKTKDGDYQLVMVIEEADGDRELFWMDSTEVEDGVNYNSFSYPSQNGMTVDVTLDEYLLVDDQGKGNVLYPLLDKFTYSMTGKSAENLAEGTYTATPITEPGEDWTSNWLVGESVDDYDNTVINPYLGLVEDNDDCDCVVTRRYFNYRDFGELTIGVGDHNKGYSYGHDDNGFFFIKSNQEEAIKRIHDAWGK
jgi:hypothetical protein